MLIDVDKLLGLKSLAIFAASISSFWSKNLHQSFSGQWACRPSRAVFTVGSPLQILKSVQTERMTEFSSVRFTTLVVVFFAVTCRSPNLFCIFLRKYAVIARPARVLGDADEPISGVTAGMLAPAGATMGSVCGRGVFTVQ